ncbi:allantoinase AllB [Halobacillus sp. KGW1]|uniref:allantoinase AllB n=1 Tax=Halobacillus sp. KGW1 TaxID=1793726 RepID=UPI00078658A7|nr:allantoinase AllB [Halobacillus sp. KGW1]
MNGTLDLIIKQASVVLESGILQKDIGVKNGKVVSIEDTLSQPAADVYDASGLHLFPGMIDTHVHFNEPGREEWEGFTTGSRMMAAGGATMFFDMPLNGIPSTTTRGALIEKQRVAAQKSLIDFRLWGGLVPGNEHHLASMAEEGVIGFKAFLSETGNDEFEAVDDHTLIQGMKEIAKTGKILALHAESGPMTAFLTKEFSKRGNGTPEEYLASRPVEAELEAVERAIYYAEIAKCPLHFVHISSKRSLERIEAAKAKGMDITVETCAHYLLFNHIALKQKGAIAKCAPPLRSEEEQKELIELVMEERFDFITSDHSPCPPDMKSSDNLFESWGGISGGQFTLLSMVELAVTYNIPFEKIASLTAGNAARRFQLENKGHIRIGNDADFALVNTRRPFTVTEDNFRAKHKHSIYMGHTFPCTIEASLSRGRMVFKQDYEKQRTN